MKTLRDMPSGTGIYEKHGKTGVRWCDREALPPRARAAYDAAARCHATIKEDILRLLSEGGKIEAQEDNAMPCAQRIADQCLTGDIPFPYYMPDGDGFALAPHVRKAAYSLRHRRWIDSERHGRRGKRGGGAQTLSLDAQIANGDDGLTTADTVQSSAELPCYSLLPLSAAASDDAAAFSGYLEQAGVPSSLFTRNELLILHVNWKDGLRRNACAVSRALGGRLSHTTCRALLASAKKKIREIL